MNDLDRQLIALLRENARMPVVALAKKLQVARATVQNRIARLEQDGVIVGYTLRLRPEEDAQQIRAIMSVAVESNREEAVMRMLRGHVAVVTLHSVNGHWDLVAELRLENLEAFEQLIGSVRAMSGVKATETSIVLATYKM
ncbi:Lrp/AsnC family transcriptional regulator [Lautropia dentalis]|uniref:Lrp/AsnC family transcriptional regulator n=1 Tax=Lautropia dentalis TaxID=2490857 RepID=A0A3R8LRS7_9BURK|nr:Lrp/AsnC family transcriptional regulator [Lautropia dentalis]RRN45308.1 Lrp/AsnC family transcriptional regulator [Lautropia dentalis]